MFVHSKGAPCHPRVQKAKCLWKKMGCNSLQGQKELPQGKLGSVVLQQENVNSFIHLFPVNIIFYINFRLSKNLNMVSWNLGTRGEWVPFSHSRVQYVSLFDYFKAPLYLIFSCNILLYSQIACSVCQGEETMMFCFSSVLTAGLERRPCFVVTPALSHH